MEPRISLITLGVDDLERSRRFYAEGLGFPAHYTAGEGILFFRTRGTRLALYPREQLAKDISPRLLGKGSGFPGITLAHNTREKAEVDAILARAEAAGGTLIKPAAETFWGGYSGYFADPDGHLWEVAWAEFWRFDEQGALVLD
jgi:catechol 2,3-dioxygenase-like lactoylglutathione lyase family enzyme